MSLSHLLIPLVVHLFQGDTGETGEPGPQGEVGPPVSYLSLFHFIFIKKNTTKSLSIMSMMLKRDCIYLPQAIFLMLYTSNSEF